VRVGEEAEGAAERDLGADQQVDQWFTGPWAGQHHNDNLSKLKLYASVCRRQLGEQYSELCNNTNLNDPYTHSYTSGCLSRPARPAGAVRVRCLAQGHLDTRGSNP